MKRLFLSLIFILALVIANGCDKSPTDTPDPISLDEQEVLQALGEDADYFPSEFRDNDWVDGGGAAVAGSGGNSIAEEIDPLRFRRQVLSRSVTRTVEFTSDSTATVTINYALSGILHIIGATEDDTTHYEKEFADSGVRYAYLARRHPSQDRPRRWYLTAFSGTLIEAENGTVDIQSIQFSSNSVDTTITDILGLANRENILSLPRGEEVTVTVTTANIDDDLFIHYRPRHRFRRPLESNGDGTYTLAWTPIRFGVHHAVFDAMSQGTLHDSDAPYDDMGWGISYRVVVD